MDKVMSNEGEVKVNAALCLQGLLHDHRSAAKSSQQHSSESDDDEDGASKMAATRRSQAGKMLPHVSSSASLKCRSCTFLARSREGLFVHQAVHKDMTHSGFSVSAPGEHKEVDSNKEDDSTDAPRPGDDHWCRRCGRRFQNAYNVRRHLRNVHGVQVEPPSRAAPKFLCPYCGHGPGSSVLIRWHMDRAHTLAEEEEDWSGDDDDVDNGTRFSCRHCPFRHRYVGVVRVHQAMLHK